MNMTSLTHLIEYFRLGLVWDEEQNINRWAGQFLRAREAELLDNCRQLLHGIKRSGLDLSLRSRAVIIHCEALLAALLDRPNEAEAGYRRSLALFRQAGDNVGLGWVLNDLGTLHYTRGEWPQAVDCYREALARLLATRQGMTDEAMARNNLGLALIGLGQHEEGLVELEQAGNLYQQLGTPQFVAKVKVNLGQLYHRQGNISRASTVYQEALKTLREIGDQRTEVTVFNSLGVLYRYQGQFDQAANYHTQSLSLAQNLNDLSGQALALGNLGAIFQLQHHLSQARSCYQEALALYEMVDDRQGQAQMWANLGHLHSLAHECEAALASQQRSLHLYQAVNDAAGEAKTLVNVANAFRDLEQYTEAETHFQEALALAQKLADVRLQDQTIGALGTLRMAQERWTEAEPLLRKALALQQQRGDMHAQVETLYKLGWVAYKQGQHERVLPIIEPAWELAQEHEYGRWLFDLAQLIGHAARAQNDPGATNYYAAAVAIACQYEDRYHLREGLNYLGELVARAVESGEHQEALEFCEYLTEFWAKEEWRDWTGPAIAYIKATSGAIHNRQPLPVEISEI